MLDLAFGLTEKLVFLLYYVYIFKNNREKFLIFLSSRLGCQIIVNEKMHNWIVTVPKEVADARN